MTNYFKLPTWADKDHVHAVVETPRGSRVKLEFDPKLGAFTLAKPLFAGLTYPYDWGPFPSIEVGQKPCWFPNGQGPPACLFRAPMIG
jgi:inorganic pyrophosphatase